MNIGHYWKGISSFIISHVHDESGSFIPSYVQSPANFTFYLSHFILEPSLEKVRREIEVKYPASGPPYYGDQ